MSYLENFNVFNTVFDIIIMC